MPTEITASACTWAAPNEYQEYKRRELDKQIADENRMAAEEAEMASMDWGLWGPWW